MPFDLAQWQGRPASLLTQALRKNRLPHGLLFLGPEGSGRRAAAVELTKTLFCESPLETKACETCHACRLVKNGSHPDLFRLMPDKGARAVKVEDIRSLIARCSLKPMQAACKVFILENIESLNDTAQNAFLKTLEEPEGHTYFILIATGLDGLLPTLRSRLQTVYFMPPDAAFVADPAAEKIKRQVLDFMLYRVDALRPGRDTAPVDVMLGAPEIAKEERQTLGGGLDAVVGYYRDVLLLAAGVGDSLGRVEDKTQKEKLSQVLTETEIADRIELLALTKERVATTVNTKLALAALWDGLA